MFTTLFQSLWISNLNVVFKTGCLFLTFIQLFNNWKKLSGFEPLNSMKIYSKYPPWAAILPGVNSKVYVNENRYSLSYLFFTTYSLYKKLKFKAEGLIRENFIDRIYRINWTEHFPHCVTKKSTLIKHYCNITVDPKIIFEHTLNFDEYVCFHIGDLNYRFNQLISNQKQIIEAISNRISKLKGITGVRYSYAIQ